MRRFLPLLLLFLPLAFGAWTPWQTGQTWVNGPWYCRAMSSTTYRCTQHWHRSGSAIISDNPAWVPNTTPTRSGGYLAVHITTTHVTLPGNSYPFGQCTWGADALSGNQLNGLGNAKDWLANARMRGLPTGSTPQVGATVVYQSGVQGASALGHVAHVVAVYANGSFLVREMNYYGFGGGWGAYSYRTSWTGWGVGFIY